MNKDKVKGKMTEIGGKVKEGAGKLTGNDRLKAEGKTDQVKGKVQKAWGNVKDIADKGTRKAEDISQGVSDSLNKDHHKAERDKSEQERKKDVA